MISKCVTVKNQGEVLLDSAIMALSSHVLQKCTSSLNSNISSYDSHEFASKIVRLYNPLLNLANILSV